MWYVSPSVDDATFGRGNGGGCGGALNVGVQSDAARTVGGGTGGAGSGTIGGGSRPSGRSMWAKQVGSALADRALPRLVVRQGGPYGLPAKPVPQLSGK